MHRLLVPGAACTGSAGVTGASHASQSAWPPVPISTHLSQMCAPNPTMSSAASPFSGYKPLTAHLPHSFGRRPPSGTLSAAAASLSQYSRMQPPDPGSVGAPPAAVSLATGAEPKVCQRTSRGKRTQHRASGANQHSPPPHTISASNSHSLLLPVKPYLQAASSDRLQALGARSSTSALERAPSVDSVPATSNESKRATSMESNRATCITSRAALFMESKRASSMETKEPSSIESRRPQSTESEQKVPGQCDSSVQSSVNVDRALRAGDTCVVRTGKMSGASGRVRS